MNMHTTNIASKILFFAPIFIFLIFRIVQELLPPRFTNFPGDWNTAFYATLLIYVLASIGLIVSTSAKSVWINISKIVAIIALLGSAISFLQPTDPYGLGQLGILLLATPVLLICNFVIILVAAKSKGAPYFRNNLRLVILSLISFALILITLIN